LRYFGLHLLVVEFLDRLYMPARELAHALLPRERSACWKSMAAPADTPGARLPHVAYDEGSGPSELSFQSTLVR
jgi:hypothetical protein